MADAISLKIQIITIFIVNIVQIQPMIGYSTHAIIWISDRLASVGVTDGKVLIVLDVYFRDQKPVKPM